MSGALAFAVACLPNSAPTYGQQQPQQPDFVSRLARPWTGDLDGMLKRRFVRFLVPYNKTLYMIDRGRQMGLVAELGQAFEAWLNVKYAKDHLKVHVVFLPAARDALIPDLTEGKGDVVAGELTITPERQALVDFATPWVRDVKEVVVTGPSSPNLASLDDLSDKEAFVRASSAYSGSLRRLNADFAARGLKPIAIRPIDEDSRRRRRPANGERRIPYAIVDDYQAKVWAKILPGLRVRDDLVIHDDGAIAWAVRKNSPLLQKELAAFIAAHGPNTSFGATVMRRYFTGPEALRNADLPVAMQRFQELLRVFERSGAKYGFDDLMLMAQGYQEFSARSVGPQPPGRGGRNAGPPFDGGSAPIEHQRRRPGRAGERRRWRRVSSSRSRQVRERSHAQGPRPDAHDFRRL